MLNCLKAYKTWYFIEGKLCGILIRGFGFIAACEVEVLEDKQSFETQIGWDVAEVVSTEKGEFSVTMVTFRPSRDLTEMV